MNDIGTYVYLMPYTAYRIPHANIHAMKFYFHSFPLIRQLMDIKSD